MRISNYPSIDVSDKRMLFSERQYLRMAGKLLILFSLAGVALATSLPDVPPAAYFTILFAAGILVILGGIVSFWTQTVLLDFENAVCVSKCGPQFMARLNTIPLADSDHVLLTREGQDETGEVDSARCSLSVAFPERQILLFNRRKDEGTVELANTIADHLDRPLRVTELYPESRVAPRNTWWVSGVMWTAMLTVAGIMLWPVISGSRPLLAQFGGGRKGIFADSETVLTPYQKGVSQYGMGQFVEAEKTFREAHKATPKDAEIVNMLAYSLAEQGKMDAALETANEALKLEPGSGNITDTVAEMYERRKEFEPAAEWYARALQRIDIKEAAETNTKYARTLIALDRKSEAKKHLLNAVKFPNPRWDQYARRLLLKLDPTIKLPRPIPSPTLNLRGPVRMPMMLRP